MRDIFFVDHIDLLEAVVDIVWPFGKKFCYIVISGEEDFAQNLYIVASETLRKK